MTKKPLNETQLFDLEGPKAGIMSQMDIMDRIDEYMELAQKASSKKKKLEYINAALELDPEDLDVAVTKIRITAKDSLEAKAELEGLLAVGNAQMKKGGYFKYGVGDFWRIIETRPFMRLKHDYMSVLLNCKMMRRAADECEDMLRLCKGDNLGVRYELMHIYAYLEDEAAALKLYNKFNEYEECQMLLPLSILYFKLGDLEKSLAYLKRVAANNKDLKRFLIAVTSGKYDELLSEISPYGYQPNTAGELMAEFSENEYLFRESVSFIWWAKKQIKK